MDHAHYYFYSGVHVQKEKTVKKIAFFDFDGTITTHDTLLEFIKFSKGSGAFYTGFAMNSPFLVAMKLKLLSNQPVKEKILRYFFGGMPEKNFNEACHNFQEQCLPQLIRPGALKEIKKFQEEGIEVIIVSASPENWIRQWAESQGLKLIATKLEVKDGKITGLISGKNCYGIEKVNRIRELFQLEQYEAIYAYGDSSGDNELLAIAHFPSKKPFRESI